MATYGQFSKTGSKIGMEHGPDVEYNPARKLRTLEKFRELAGTPPALPHLDVGSGPDHARKYFDWEVTTSDVDLDTDRFDFADGMFRTISSFEVLEHLYNPLFHLMEVQRVLHPGGRFYCVTPNDYSLIYKAEHLLERKFAPHFHQFSEYDLQQITARAGLKIEHLEKFTRGPVGTLARISRNVFFMVCSK